MIVPIKAISSNMNFPKKRQIFMRIDYEKHTVVCENGVNFTLPPSEAWALLDKIKSGEIYDETV